MIYLAIAHKGTRFAVIFDDEFSLHRNFEDAEKEARQLADDFEVSIMDLTESTEQHGKSEVRVNEPRTSAVRQAVAEEQAAAEDEADAEAERLHNNSLRAGA